MAFCFEVCLGFEVAIDAGSHGWRGLIGIVNMVCWQIHVDRATGALWVTLFDLL